MPSPFPGVDPYLEDQGYWPDFHATFLNYWRESVAEALPPQYEARIDERIHMEVQERLLLRPDIAVVRQGEFLGGESGAVAVETDTVTVPLPIWEAVRETNIHILHRPDRTLVAVLKLLSPSNKIAPGRNDYINKRTSVISQSVHLVELDLLLGGERLPMRRPLPPGDFYAIIARSEQRPNAQVLPWTLRHKLPRVPIPLLKPDPDSWIDLNAVFATAYARGRYAQSINYSARLSLPMPESAVRWIEETVKQR